MTLTSKDIRLAYAALHGVTSIAEYEKYDLMNAKQYPAEWLELQISEFMVMAGFVAETKAVSSDVLCYPTEGVTLRINVIGDLHAEIDELTKDVVIGDINAQLDHDETDQPAAQSKSVIKRVNAQSEAKPKRKYTKKIK